MVMLADTVGIRTGYLAGRFPGGIGHLFSPRPNRNPPGPFHFCPYALDNGAFAGGENWSETAWTAMLEWARLSGQSPLWLLVPDVVGDRLRTLRRWDIYAPAAARFGWPLAFAVQDGMTPEDVPAEAQVIFVGGSTAWKLQTIALWCRSFQRVHIGRVNTYKRLWLCHDAGAESIDGTGWMRGDQVQYRGLLAYLMESTGARVRHEQMELVC